jgi:hypothetical protein
VVATKELFSVDRISFPHLRRERLDGTLRKIDAGHRLIDLERSSLMSLGIDVVPVEKPEGHVAVFLNFKNHDVPQ